MTTTCEIVAGSSVVGNAETLIATLTAWHPRVNVQVTPASPDTKTINTEWRLYAVKGADRSLIAAGYYVDDGEPNPTFAPQLVLRDVPGAGDTIALYAVTSGRPTSVAMGAELIGWNPDDGSSPSEVSAQGTATIGTANTTFATLASWRASANVAVQTADPKAIGSLWELCTNIGGNLCVVAAATLRELNQVIFRDVQAGGETWSVRARTKGPVTGNVIATLYGTTTPAGAGGSGGGGAGPNGLVSVADLVTLQFLDPGPTKIVGARVGTLLANFWLDPDSTLPPDGITVIGAIGGGSWVRSAEGDPQWAAQTTWFIDSAAGSDENSGQAGHPIETHAELMRRWKSQTLAAAAFVVNIAALTDPINLEGLSFIDPRSTTINYVGAVTSPGGGSVTSAAIANPATQTPWQITDIAGAFSIGDRIRLTSGAAVNTLFWVDKGAIGDSPARVSYPFLGAVESAVANGDNYVIEVLQHVDANVDTGPIVGVQFDNLSLSLAASGSSVIMTACTFKDLSLEDTIFEFVNCSDDNTAVQPALLANSRGAFLGGRCGVGLQIQNGSAVQMRSYLMSQIVLAILSGASVEVVAEGPGGLAVFDSSDAGVAVGNTVTLGVSNGFPSNVASLVAQTPLWGNGNSDVGLTIGSGCVASVQLGAGFITGASGDITLGGLTDPATAFSWDPVAGVYAPSPITWAAFNVIVGQLGIYNPAQVASLIAALG